MNEVERLAVAQMLYNEAAKLVSTKDRDSLRASVDRRYKELYDSTGCKSYDVRIGDDVVGTYSLRFSKPTEQKEREVFEVSDYQALAQWFETCDTDSKIEFAANELAAFAEFWAYTNGEIPDGCEWRKVVTPATGKEYLGGTLKVDTESVLNAVGELPGGVIGLLEGEYESE